MLSGIRDTLSGTEQLQVRRCVASCRVLHKGLCSFVGPGLFLVIISGGGEGRNDVVFCFVL